MSFYTSLTFVRPTQPPRMSVAELLAFADRIADTGVMSNFEPGALRIILGKRIDADHRDAEEWDEVLPRLFRSKPRKYDVDIPSAAEFVRQHKELLANDSPVYRAYMDCGLLNPTIGEALQTDRPDDGLKNLYLGTVSLNCGVIRAHGMGGNGEAPVGWIGVTLSGNGYLFPWEPKDLISRAREVPELNAVERVCRETFPVVPVSNGWFARFRGQRTLRRAQNLLGAFNPYPNGAIDWAWSIHESG